MDKKIINAVLYSVAAVSVLGAGVAYLAKENARQEYESRVAAEQAKPELPVSVSYREAFMGSGLVASFKNSSNRHLSLVATFSNPTLKTTKAYPIRYRAWGSSRNRAC